MKHRLSRLQILQYALEGVRHRIGSHAAPHEYPEEIEELEAHERSLIRRIEATERGLAQHEDPPDGTGVGRYAQVLDFFKYRG